MKTFSYIILLAILASCNPFTDSQPQNAFIWQGQDSVVSSQIPNLAGAERAFWHKYWRTQNGFFELAGDTAYKINTGHGGNFQRLQIDSTDIGIYHITGQLDMYGDLDSMRYAVLCFLQPKAIMPDTCFNGFWVIRKWGVNRHQLYDTLIVQCSTLIDSVWTFQQDSLYWP